MRWNSLIDVVVHVVRVTPVKTSRMLEADTCTIVADFGASMIVPCVSMGMIADQVSKLSLKSGETILVSGQLVDKPGRTPYVLCSDVKRL